MMVILGDFYPHLMRARWQPAETAAALNPAAVVGSSPLNYIYNMTGGIYNVKLQLWRL